MCVINIGSKEVGSSPLISQLPKLYNPLNMLNIYIVVINILGGVSAAGCSNTRRALSLFGKL